MMKKIIEENGTITIALKVIIENCKEYSRCSDGCPFYSVLNYGGCYFHNILPEKWQINDIIKKLEG